jgi:REP element-mobilizing transposase RayT
MPVYHGKDLRKGRHSERNQHYLVTTTTVKRKPVFVDLSTGRLLVDELRRISEAELVDSLAWVIMPDHLHWLFILKGNDLSLVLRTIKSRSAVAINQYNAATGKVWQKGFHDRAIRRDEDIKTVARYIIANPLRAGITKIIGNYPLWDAVWI